MYAKCSNFRAFRDETELLLCAISAECAMPPTEYETRLLLLSEPRKLEEHLLPGRVPPKLKILGILDVADIKLSSDFRSSKFG